MSLKPMPDTISPGMRIQLLDGSYWSLNDAKANNFAMLIFYRGRHCPICEEYLMQFDELVDDFAGLGVEMIAISGDRIDKATETQSDWGLKKLRIGSGLTEDQMRDWGLFISEGIKQGEPDLFSEPGLFLVSTDDLKLFSAIIGSVPFGRPEPKAMFEAIDFIVEEKYPPRGAKSAVAAVTIEG